MVFKKPYAFLIKNFKVIHIILCVIILFITNKFNSLVTFFGNYATNSIKVVEGTASTYISTLFVLATIFVITFSVIMIILMRRKNKPFTFYILTAIYYILILVLLIVAANTITSLYDATMSQKTSRALRDIYLILSFPNYYFIVMYIIRGIGFDIKKFNFSKDLKELEISAEDNEEFEFVLGTDTYKYERKARRIIREFKYYILEHKFIFTIIGGALGITLLIIIMVNININPTHRTGKAVVVNGLQIKVNKSYITEYDYNGNLINNNEKYVIVDLSLKSIGKEKVLNKDEVYLTYGNNKIYFKNTLKDYFIDFGKAYNGSVISKDKEERVTLIFPISKKTNTKSFKLNILNSVSINNENTYTYEYSKFKIKAKNIDKTIIEENKNYNEIMYLGETTFNKSYIIIKSAKIVPCYEYEYENCTNNECKTYIGVEKTENSALQKLLVVTYEAELDNTLPIINTFNSNKYSSLFDKMLKIRYKNNDKTYIYSGTAKTNSYVRDTVFITVQNEVANSEGKEILIQTRSSKYFLNLT